MPKAKPSVRENLSSPRDFFGEREADLFGEEQRGKIADRFKFLKMKERGGLQSPAELKVGILEHSDSNEIRPEQFFNYAGRDLSAYKVDFLQNRIDRNVLLMHLDMHSSALVEAEQHNDQDVIEEMPLETITIQFPGKPYSPDIKYIRQTITGLSQTEFSKTYQINLATLQSWESSNSSKRRTEPSKAAKAYLQVIELESEWVADVLRNAPKTIDVEKVWEKTNLDTDEFSFLFRLGQTYLQRWIKGTVSPSGPALALLKLIDANPTKVIETLYGQVAHSRPTFPDRSLTF